MTVRFHPMFFFGTLMDRDVLTAVLGREVADGDVRPAVLDGWRRAGVAGRSYPMLVRHPAGRVEGLLVDGLDGDDRERLERYEGPEYRVAALTVRADGGDVPAGVFLCRPEVEAGRREWRLEDWRRRHKPSTLAAIRRRPGYYFPNL